MLTKSFGEFLGGGDFTLGDMSIGNSIFARPELFFHDGIANLDALITDVDSWACDEFFHLRVAFATEGAHGDIG